MEEAIRCRELEELIKHVEEDIEKAKSGKEIAKKGMAEELERLLGKTWFLYKEPKKRFDITLKLFDKAIVEWANYLEELKKGLEVCER